MPIREVYVGALGRNMQLDWGGDPDVGNVPRRLSPIFPISGARIHPYTLVINWIACERLRGRRVDWGAYAASVSIADLHEILLTSYGAGRIPAELMTFVSSLTTNRRYAIVAATSEELATDGDPSSIGIKQPLLLCMSDNKTTVTVLKQMVGGNMEVVATSDQVEALNLIRFGDPAAVIFDMAPAHFMAGLEALNMQCGAQNVPLIVIAPNRQAASIAHAMSSGAVHCVMKPLSAEKLDPVVQRCTEEHGVSQRINPERSVLHLAMARKSRRASRPQE
jgi:CheY-like chemotaxis protein